MASIAIRNVDGNLKRRVHACAAQHGRSMEEEARGILHRVVTEPAPPLDLAAAVRVRIAPLSGAALDIPPREPMRAPPMFD